MEKHLLEEDNTTSDLYYPTFENYLEESDQMDNSNVEKDESNEMNNSNVENDESNEMNMEKSEEIRCVRVPYEMIGTQSQENNIVTPNQEKNIFMKSIATEYRISSQTSLENLNKQISTPNNKVYFNSDNNLNYNGNHHSLMNDDPNWNQLQLNNDIPVLEECHKEKSSSNNLFNLYDSSIQTCYFYSSDYIRNKKNLRRSYDENNLKRRIINKFRKNYIQEMNFEISTLNDNLKMNFPFLTDNTKEFQQKVDNNFLKKYGLQPIKNYFLEKNFDRLREITQTDLQKLQNNERVVKLFENNNIYPEITKKFNNTFKDCFLEFLNNERLIKDNLNKDVENHKLSVLKKFNGKKITDVELNYILNIFRISYLSNRNYLIRILRSLVDEKFE